MFAMLCKICGKLFSESQYSKDGKYKSCPRCSMLNGEEHVYYLYPNEFGTTAKRSSADHPDGPQSYCARHRPKGCNNMIYGNGILCSEL